MSDQAENHRVKGDPGAAFTHLYQVVERLRAPGGCPWDREQTHASLRPYVVEEAYEVVGAIEEGAGPDLAGELGDLLLQVMLHSVIAAEAGSFTVHDVLDAITNKIIRRHPHVFGDAEARTAADVKATWEAIKRQERGQGAAPGQDKATAPPSALEGVSTALPGLLEAGELQGRAASVGFDWQRAEDAWPKVEEEAAEFQAAWQEGDRAAMEEELGDLLFAVVNVARLLKIDPEVALKGTNRKFTRRFHAVEALAREEGRRPEEMELQEMDRLWDLAKANERKNP